MKENAGKLTKSLQQEFLIIWYSGHPARTQSKEKTENPNLILIE